MQHLFNDDHIKQEKFTIKSYGVLIENKFIHISAKVLRKMLYRSIKRERISNKSPTVPTSRYKLSSATQVVSLKLYYYAKQKNTIPTVRRTQAFKESLRKQTTHYLSSERALEMTESSLQKPSQKNEILPHKRFCEKMHRI